MAKLKSNHSSQSSAGGGMFVKVGVFAALIGALYWAFNQFSGGKLTTADPTEASGEPSGNDDIFNSDNGPAGPSMPTVSDRLLPTSTTGQIIKHEFYALSYSEEHEQAEWVAYELTKESIQAPNVGRTGDFRPDPKISKASASTRDYTNSGYDRGHLAPAGDMAFSERAMSETFYMSNISPQIRNFNGGVWRELEENTRDWAYKFKRVYVATGPVLTKGIREQIGGNKVSVPDEFYKVILDLDEPEVKAIAFVIPNEISTRPLQDYATSVDYVETLTGIDFFPGLFSDKEHEARLESDFDVSLWPMKSSRYHERLDQWNKRK